MFDKVQPIPFLSSSLLQILPYFLSSLTLYTHHHLSLSMSPSPSSVRLAYLLPCRSPFHHFTLSLLPPLIPSSLASFIPSYYPRRSFFSSRPLHFTQSASFLFATTVINHPESLTFISLALDPFPDVTDYLPRVFYLSLTNCNFSPLSSLSIS